MPDNYRSYNSKTNSYELYHSIKNLISDYEKQIAELEKMIDPKDNRVLKVGKHRNSVQCYLVNRETGKSEYISLKDNRIHQIIQNDYLKKVLKRMQSQKKQLEKLAKIMQPVSTLSKIPASRRRFVNPIPWSPEAIISSLLKSKKTKNPLFPDYLLHMTARGDKVRSKSEVMIADELFRRNITYEYETTLLVGGLSAVPDFTIFNHKTNRLMIWEHLGLLDDQNYRDEAIRKYNAYVANGFTPGVDLFFTFETQRIPFTRQDIIRTLSLMELI